MAEEVGIVMSLYDQVPPTLKAIAGSSQAFDKTLDDLEESIKAYDRAQDGLVKQYASLKKAMAETDNQVKAAHRSYKKLNDEASKKALDEAIDRQAELRRALNETESSLKINAKAYDNLNEQALKAAKGIRETENAASRADNRADGVSMLSALGKAGIAGLVGDSISQAAGNILESSVGQPTATAVSGVLSGITSGIAMGAMTGTPAGIAAGAVLGGISGLANATATVGGAKDDAFKGYVQEAAEGQLSARDNAISSGSAVAAQRELDAIAFNKLLGKGVGDRYLEDLRAMAAETPMEYGDLTAMSRALATGFGDSPERMLELMKGIGNAGSAVGLGASDMTVMAQAMSRMESSDKAGLESLNMLQERGVDVIGMLAGSLGVSQGEVYDMISKGAISGTQAVGIIQQGLEQYAGAMDEMSRTFSGLSSTLADVETEMDAAYGEGYNAERAKGIQAQTDWLGGASGEAQQEANKAIGAWQASLENAKEAAIRDAVDAAMESTDYREAKEAGDAAEMGRIIMEAKVQGMNEYNASEGAQLALESEKALISGIRADAGLRDEYWDAGYEMGLEYSKGLEAGRADALRSSGFSYAAVVGSSMEVRAGGGIKGRYAYGLDRVPYDNYAALLHEGERVLTAREAREQDRSGGLPPISISVSGNTFGAGMDEAAVAEAIAQAVSRKLQAGFQV